MQGPDPMDEATRLIQEKLGREARLEITWTDRSGWLAGWSEQAHRFRVRGTTVEDAVATLTRTLSTMPTLRVRP